MVHPLGSFELAIVPRHPSLVIQENELFFQEWPKIKANIHFLLKWRGIIEDHSKAWLRNYLSIFNSYIQLGVELDNLEALDFDIPNMEKSNREKHTFEFSPNFQTKNPKNIAEIIMVY